MRIKYIIAALTLTGGVAAGNEILLQQQEAAKKALNALLAEAYVNNPYGLAPRLSRDTMKSYENTIISYYGIPEKGKWMVTGNVIYDYNMYGNKEYWNQIDEGGIAEAKNTLKTNTYGGLVTGEYGAGEKFSIGGAFALADQSTEFKGPVKLTGTSYYGSIYAKKMIDRFNFIAGAGYQQNSYNNKRTLRNSFYDLSYDKNFDTTGYNLYMEGRYSYPLESNWFIEPKLRFSYSYVSQESVGHDFGMVSLEVDEKNVYYFDSEIGFNLFKEFFTELGKVKFVTGLSYINTQGNTQDEIYGRVPGMANFSFKIDRVEKNSGRIKLALELENKNGILYSFGTNVKLADNLKRDSDVNWNLAWETQIGIGYKF